MNGAGRLTPSHLAFGLTLYVIFALSLASMLGLIPDREGAIRQGRTALCEALAINSAILVNTGQLTHLEESLCRIVERDNGLTSAGVRLSDGQLLIEAGSHETGWLGVECQRGAGTQVCVPIGMGEDTWGSLELRFRPLQPPGIWRFRAPPLAQIVILVGGFCFLGFQFFLSYARRSMGRPSIKELHLSHSART
jgi:hypothetical protein